MTTTTNSPTTTSHPDVRLRAAQVEDGAAIAALVRESGVLDVNSTYAYVLLCDRFRDTCVVAEVDAQIYGFVTAFIPPRKSDTVFVWQIGVDARARGQRIGARILDCLVEQPACAAVRYLETTVSPSNHASEALFRSFARRHGASVSVHEGYQPTLFGNADHEPEPLYRIGPLR